MSDEEYLALLKEAHDEPIDPAHYAAVRARVLGELARRQRPLWTRGWVWVTAATLVLAGVIAMRVDVRPQLEPPVVRLLYPAAPEVARAAKRVPAVVRRVKPEPLVIKLVTDNPDVVIYWIADKRGDD